MLFSIWQTPHSFFLNAYFCFLCVIFQNNLFVHTILIFIMYRIFVVLIIYVYRLCALLLPSIIYICGRFLSIELFKSGDYGDIFQVVLSHIHFFIFFSHCVWGWEYFNQCSSTRGYDECNSRWMSADKQLNLASGERKKEMSRRENRDKQKIEAHNLLA